MSCAAQALPWDTAYLGRTPPKQEAKAKRTGKYGMPRLGGQPQYEKEE